MRRSWSRPSSALSSAPLTRNEWGLWFHFFSSERNLLSCHYCTKTMGTRGQDASLLQLWPIGGLAAGDTFSSSRVKGASVWCAMKTVEQWLTMEDGVGRRVDWRWYLLVTVWEWLVHGRMRIMWQWWGCWKVLTKSGLWMGLRLKWRHECGCFLGSLFWWLFRGMQRFWCAMKVLEFREMN